MVESSHEYIEGLAFQRWWVKGCEKMAKHLYKFLCGGPILIFVPIHNCRGWCPITLVPRYIPSACRTRWLLSIPTPLPPHPLPPYILLKALGSMPTLNPHSPPAKYHLDHALPPNHQYHHLCLCFSVSIFIGVKVFGNHRVSYQVNVS